MLSGKQLNFFINIYLLRIDTKFTKPINKSYILLSKKEIFYNRETVRGIRISQLTEIPPLDRDWLRSLNYEKG